MKRNFGLAFVLFVLISSFLIVIQPVKASEDSWIAKAPMLTARFSFGIAVANGALYAIGGALSTQTGTLLASNEEYEPITDTWYEKTPLPTPTYACAVATYENQIYVFGGQIKGNNGLEVNTNSTKVYDILTDKWISKAPMPTARSLLQANVVDGKIYLIGGDVGGTSNEVYDPAKDTWSSKASMPYAAYAYACGIVDKKIYVISSLTQIYDTQTDTWSLGAAIPVAVAAAGSAVITASDNTTVIYVVGGETDIFSPQAIVQIYLPEKNSWGFGASLPLPTSRLCVASLNNLLYAVGGTRAVMHQGITDNLQCSPGQVSFIAPPSSLSPSPSASLSPNQPFPTPSPTIPELSSLSALFLLIVASFSLLFFKRRNLKRLSQKR
jgi:N-acetylneuraminic acid mutarotase